jgi:hypothetical protein
MKKLIEWFWITNLGVYLEDNKKQVVKYILIFLLCFLLLVFVLWIRYLVIFENFDLRRWPEWTLFEEQLWDWMELLIVPTVLTILAVMFNKAERKADREAIEKRVATDREISKDRQYEDALQSYLDMMMELVVTELIEGKQVSKDVQSMGYLPKKLD